MPRIRGKEKVYAAEDFRKEVRTKQGVYDLMSKSALAEAVGLPRTTMTKRLADPMTMTFDEFCRINETIHPDIRLRTKFPYYLQMIISFNPISITHWLKKRFFDNPDPRATVHESTYKDNRFLTQEAIQTLEAFKERDEYPGAGTTKKYLEDKLQREQMQMMQLQAQQAQTQVMPGVAAAGGGMAAPGINQQASPAIGG